MGGPLPRRGGASDGDRVRGGRPGGLRVRHRDAASGQGHGDVLYELAVDESYRRRGIGRALTAAVAAVAQERGCYGMWVGVEAPAG
ncbi:GNAT family N-acetyltransferase [Streptomyces sp. BE230]|uniref:GNAT family N-acetyltransferase n=1 Tax=Streptomyces sp. BE230 TaxID=3002526 RepID=UPI002ED0942B|nr:GNAT family N-acetyltransferase [Streptomyces sp. BE230]